MTLKPEDSDADDVNGCNIPAEINHESKDQVFEETFNEVLPFSCIEKPFKKYNQDEEAEIFTLNDDCLLEILNCLSLDDQINFAKSDERLMTIFKLWKRFTTIDLERFLDCKQLQNFLDCFKSDIEVLVTNKRLLSERMPIDMLELTIKSCNNLMTIELFAKIITSKHLYLLSTVKKLTNLSLVYCNLNDMDLREIAQIPNLEFLDISYNKKLSGDYLSEFSKLKYLNIRNCTGIESRNFVAFCYANRELKILDITNGMKLQQSSIRALALNWQNIEILKLSSSIDGSIANELLKKLTGLNYLSELDISYCQGFTTESLMQFLIESPQLKCLSIKGCNQIERNFLFEAINLVEKQEGRKEVCQIVTSLKKDENILRLISDKFRAIISFEKPPRGH